MQSSASVRLSTGGGTLRALAARAYGRRGNDDWRQRERIRRRQLFRPDSSTAGDDETIDVLYNADGSARDGVDLSPHPFSILRTRLSSLLRLLGASTAFVTDGLSPIPRDTGDLFTSSQLLGREEQIAASRAEPQPSAQPSSDLPTPRTTLPCSRPHPKPSKVCPWALSSTPRAACEFRCNSRHLWRYDANTTRSVDAGPGSSVLYGIRT